MKTDFSIQRINLLLRKDWIENKKKLACLLYTSDAADE